MQKWQYLMLVLGWEQEKKFFYWMDIGTKVLDGIAGEKIDGKGIEKVLNQLGQEGWELVNVQTMSHLGTASVVNYYLKRPIGE